jgi:hypothetical protein
MLNKFIHYILLFDIIHVLLVAVCLCTNICILLYTKLSIAPTYGSNITRCNYEQTNADIVVDNRT